MKPRNAIDVKLRGLSELRVSYKKFRWYDKFHAKSAKSAKFAKFLKECLNFWLARTLALPSKKNCVKTNKKGNNTL